MQKLFIISDCHRSISRPLYGNSLTELKDNIYEAFLIPKSIDIKLVLNDGTEIEDDEFFSYIPNDSYVIFILPWEIFIDIEEQLTKHIDSVLKYCYKNDIISMKNFFETETFTKLKKLTTYVSNIPIKRHLSTSKEDPSWFEGLSKNIVTKEKEMFKRCQSRIRTYFTNSESQLMMNIESEFIGFILKDLIKKLKATLQTNKYEGKLFDRSCFPQCLCSFDGSFKCQGTFNQNSCIYEHFINPYDNHESLIMFSSWNLDHIIERSRTIIPGIIKFAKQGRKLNHRYFYDLLFTTNNLKLVNIVCHDKSYHKGFELDHDKIFL